MRGQLVAVVVVLLVAAIAIVASLYLAGYLNFSSGPPPPIVQFNIVESTEGPCNGFGGINDSACPMLGISAGGAPSSGPWPILLVPLGSRVIIHIENTGKFEPHGFSIQHYLPSGVVTDAGQSQEVTFIANQEGTFRVFCQIFCSIHEYMQNGELIVSSSSTTSSTT